jgi:hypothetical protein
VRRNLRAGLELVAQGYGGAGLTDDTIDWARRLVRGEAITQQKAMLMRGWLARHGPPAEEAAARRRNPLSPAAVAWLLWGADPAVAYVGLDRSTDPVFVWLRQLSARDSQGKLRLYLQGRR